MVIDVVDKSVKPRQFGRVGDACTAEENDAPLFVGLNKSFGNVGALRNKLHRSYPLSFGELAAPIHDYPTPACDRSDDPILHASVASFFVIYRSATQDCTSQNRTLKLLSFRS